MENKLENELEKARKEFMELISKELGIPKDLMSKGVVDVEKEQAHFKYQVPKPELDFESFKSSCDEMSDLVRKMCRAEEKRQEEMLILQILYVYETGMDFWHYKAIMLKIVKEMAKENPNDNFKFQMLTIEQVDFINKIKRTSRDTK